MQGIRRRIVHVTFYEIFAIALSSVVMLGTTPADLKLATVASVLAMDPDVLILDEPTIAQDVRGRRRIAEIVRTLSQRGKLVLAILHDMDFVAECFERVIVMAQGRVVAEGTPRRVFSDAEALQAARLDPPHVTQLCTRLGYEGVFLTVEEFLHACGRD